MARKKLFISHASKDRKLADALVDLIETGTTLESSDIVNLALEEKGILSGEDFISNIESQLQKARTAIVLLTPSYLTNRFCLCELGAIWAMTGNILPLLVPPLRYQNVQALISLSEIEKIDNTDDLNKLVSHLRAHIEGVELNLSQWAVKKKKFLIELPAILKEISAQ